MTRLMDRNTELRKVKPAYIAGLVNILSERGSWKKLLGLVPTDLDEVLVDLHDVTYSKRYTRDHIRLLENYSETHKVQPAEIFLQEWSIAGKKRPTIDHLKQLLIQAHLWRAADFVSEQFLKEPPPPRPLTGPPARVSIYPITSTDCRAFDEHFNSTSYPSSTLLNAFNQTHNNEVADLNLNSANNVPTTSKITIDNTIINPIRSENNNTTSNNNTISNNIISNQTLVTPQILEVGISSILRPDENMLLHINQPLVPMRAVQMTKLSTQNSQLSVQNPDFSKLLNNSVQQTISDNHPNLDSMPKISKLLSHDSNPIELIPTLIQSQNITSVDNKQSISIVTNATTSSYSDSSDSEYRPEISNLMSQNNDLPNSDILNAIDFFTSNKQSSTNNIPLISALRANSNVSIETSSTSTTSSLPELKLNTKLPHFSYTDLEFYTNNFNENPYCLDDDNRNPGRLLGSGGFGSVYLAVGLMDRNVAVKKINLQGEVITSLDSIGKLFKNEVELLYKYKHKNLVSLLGYSCDGPTYCLIYEHICSGSLGSRLLNDSLILTWIERMDIALGTATGVSYLHTAYDTPLIHRDIKSANILLTIDNTPKLCDFGLVKSTPDKTTNYTSHICGTSAYMAPEAFRGDLSVKMDTFSFGVVLFELLTALPPRDENREGKVLITYIGDNCEDDIGELLDLKAGTWIHGDIHYSRKLFELANLCIEEKKKRPTMVEVCEMLELFVDNINNSKDN